MKTNVLTSVWVGVLLTVGTAMAQFPVDRPENRPGPGPGRPFGGRDMQERGPGEAFGGGGGMRQGPMRFDRLLENPEIAKKIGLTDEQIETLKEEQYKLQTQKIDLRAKMEKAALEQARLLTKEDSSDEEILEAVKKTGKVRTDLAVVGMQQLLVIRRVLTKEQREKIQKMMRRHSHGRFRDFGHSHGGAQGGRKCPGGGPEGRSFGGRASRCGGACPKGEACERPRRRPAPPAEPKSSKQMDDDLAG